jgi:LysM repeat protein
MSIKRNTQILIVLAILFSSFVSTGSALAWNSCSNTITVQWGDTLSGIAAFCGTTVSAIQAANPGLGSWVYAGQLLCIPGAASAAVTYAPPPPAAVSYGGTYVVQWGDTLAKIAARMGIGVGDLIAANPQIANPSWIYAGQVINLPAMPVYYTVQPSDTLRSIANYYGTSVYSLQLLNPPIYDPNLIYVGQYIRVR